MSDFRLSLHSQNGRPPAEFEADGAWNRRQKECEIVSWRGLESGVDGVWNPRPTEFEDGVFEAGVERFVKETVW